MRKILGAIALMFGMGAATLNTQTLPVTGTVLWDANPPEDSVIDYLIWVDDGPKTAINCSASPCSAPATFATEGQHTVSVVAQNIFADSAPSTITVNVKLPGKVGNIKIQRQQQ